MRALVEQEGPLPTLASGRVPTARNLSAPLSLWHIFGTYAIPTPDIGHRLLTLVQEPAQRQFAVALSLCSLHPSFV